MHGVRYLTGVQEFVSELDSEKRLATDLLMAHTDEEGDQVILPRKCDYQRQLSGRKMGSTVLIEPDIQTLGCSPIK